MVLVGETGRLVCAVLIGDCCGTDLSGLPVSILDVLLFAFFVGDIVRSIISIGALELAKLIVLPERP